MGIQHVSGPGLCIASSCIASSCMYRMHVLYVCIVCIVCIACIAYVYIYVYVYVYVCIAYVSHIMYLSHHRVDVYRIIMYRIICHDPGSRHWSWTVTLPERHLVRNEFFQKQAQLLFQVSVACIALCTKKIFGDIWLRVFCVATPFIKVYVLFTFFGIFVGTTGRIRSKIKALPTPVRVIQLRRSRKIDWLNNFPRDPAPPFFY